MTPCDHCWHYCTRRTETFCCACLAIPIPGVQA